MLSISGGPTCLTNLHLHLIADLEGPTLISRTVTHWTGVTRDPRPATAC